MGEVLFKRFMIAVEVFLVNKNFIKLRERIFDNGRIIVIFYRNSLKCNVRMYVLDSNTKKRIKTFIYLTRSIKKTIGIVNENITNVIKHGERV